MICEDCSTDGTRDVLSRYRDKHPDIIKLHFNAQNLGIWGNLNKVSKLASGDVVSYLGGDDWFAPDLLANMNQTIANSGLDPQKDKFRILPNTIIWSPGHQDRLPHNEDHIKSYTPPGLFLRNLNHSRLQGISAALHRCFPDYADNSDDIGSWADLVQEVEFAKHAEHLLIGDYDGSYYRQFVGVVAKQSDRELSESYLRAVEQIIENASSENGELAECDKSYAQILAGMVRQEIDTDLPALFPLTKQVYRHLRNFPQDRKIVSRRLRIIWEKSLGNALKRKLGLMR
ncbi:hypothetical protein AIOL_002373 [Candidatus Rhodobacter oscarellae]|uniref:Glycosyltransferase 2-like domain-containing protein n=1 Tax=Candidatus Rhodobacter oscarellae TaxID=1675527 RepID=A0A0J9E3N6_9RHOB|nr:hypothetical protein AIOL_002373 [Candidatus Rhodobacter lobularis]